MSSDVGRHEAFQLFDTGPQFLGAKRGVRLAGIAHHSSQRRAAVGPLKVVSFAAQLAVEATELVDEIGGQAGQVTADRQLGGGIAGGPGLAAATGRSGREEAIEGGIELWIVADVLDHCCQQGQAEFLAPT